MTMDTFHMFMRQSDVLDKSLGLIDNLIRRMQAQDHELELMREVISDAHRRLDAGGIDYIPEEPPEKTDSENVHALDCPGCEFCGDRVH
jgi:hypothetical protein